MKGTIFCVVVGLVVVQVGYVTLDYLFSGNIMYMFICL